ncbi:hypothetical protein B484DRAFT_482836, partial [Ochromonadaceae sp. CCMP2298]
MDFCLKTTSFFGREINVICQNENGPCPLLAIANVLILKDRITISTDRSFISLDELTAIVADTILEAHPSMLDCVFNILPTLARGLDLNVIFNGVGKFEFTEAISVFDALNIPLLHGWLYDSKDAEQRGVLGGLSYNHIMFKMVEYKTLCERDAVAAAAAAAAAVAVAAAEEKKLSEVGGEEGYDMMEGVEGLEGAEG